MTVLLVTAIADDATPSPCVINARNRIAACKRAGVTPHTVTLNGEDQDAFISDANLERRDLTRGQKAMLIAISVPKQEGKRIRSLETKQLEQAGTTRYVFRKPAP